MRWKSAVISLLLMSQPALAANNAHTASPVLTAFDCEASDDAVNAKFVNKAGQLVLSIQTSPTGELEAAGVVLDRADGQKFKSLDVFLQGPCTGITFQLLCDNFTTGLQDVDFVNLCSVQHTTRNGVTQYHIVPSDLPQAGPPQIIQGYLYIQADKSAHSVIVQRVYLNGRQVPANPTRTGECQFLLF